MRKSDKKGQTDFRKTERKGRRLWGVVSLLLILTMAFGQPLSEMHVYASEPGAEQTVTDPAPAAGQETTAEPAPAQEPQPAGGESQPQDIQPAGGDVQPSQDGQPQGGDAQPSEGGDVQPAQDTQPSGDAAQDPAASDQNVPPAADGQSADSSDANVPENADTENLEETGENQEPAEAAFDQTIAMGSAAVSVRAAAGIFPAEAVLSARTLSAEEQAAADAAVAAARAAQSAAADGAAEQAASYTYAVDVLSPEGIALQPAAGNTAEVSFVLPEAADESLTAEVYSLSVDPADGQLKAAKKDSSLNRQEQKVIIQTNTITWYTVVFVPVEVEEEQDSDVTTDVKVQGVSLTHNIVGDVFVNMLGASDDPALEAKREASLAQYPLEHHDDLSYYGDSLRVRYLEGGDAEGPNYLIYRDSYLLISQEDSKNYTVTASEDGQTAYITPAIPVEQIQGKTGIVFLAEDVTYDNILVFAGEPAYDGDTMTVTLKRTEDIMANELFSDGKLVPEQQRRKPMLKATIPDIDWETSPKGTNWSGEITSFKPSWPDPYFDINVWDLLFKLGLNLTFDMDFHFTTTGSTNGKTESVRIAHLGIPIKTVFEIGLDYNLLVKFDETPIFVEGTLTTNFDIEIGTRGASVNNYRTPVKIKKLIVDPEGILSDKAKYNKDINFYIGSELSVDGKFLYLKLDLKLFSVTLGPVLKLKISAQGGSYIKACHYKDNVTLPYDKETAYEIHTCAKDGEEGCQEIEITEKNKTYIKVALDLYFDDWEWDPYDSGERQIGDPKYYYDSWTFGSDMQEGSCPHRFFKVPVNVFFDPEKMNPAGAGLEVTVADTINVNEEETELIKVTTDENGHALLFLPYKDAYWYTCVATGTIDGQPVAGSKKQTRSIKKAGTTPGGETVENEPVDIILESDAKVHIRTRIIWNVDADEKDVPSEELPLVLYRRKAGTDKWQDTEAMGGDLYYLPQMINKNDNWQVPEWIVPKFGFDENGKAFLYEYRARFNFRYLGNPSVKPEDDICDVELHVDSYNNAVGMPEKDQFTKYRFVYNEEVTEATEETKFDVSTTTITGTAVTDIILRKLWKLNPDKRVPVYLALEQKPDFGWENKAGERSVPADWVPVISPMSGETTTLKGLKDDEWLTTSDYIGSIENTPLAIRKVPVKAPGLSTTYVVPKYRNGIQMQFRGCEVNKDVIERLLIHEYGLKISVMVPSFAERFLSVPGLAVGGGITAKMADVVNIDLPEKGTLMGTVRWDVPNRSPYNDDYPDSVTLQILKDGEPVKEPPLILNKADYVGMSTWIWTLKVEGYDPDASYTVKEILSDEAKRHWFSSVSGLDVYNQHLTYDTVLCEVQAVFEDEPKDTEIIAVSVVEKDNEAAKLCDGLRLRKKEAWFSYVPTLEIDEIKDVSAYKLIAPPVAGYVQVFEEPYAYMRPAVGNLFYHFTVHYLKTSTNNNLTLHISKNWDNTDDSTVYPDKVKLTVRKDGEVIANPVLTKDEKTGEWSSAVVENLKRLDESKRKYVYTIEEEPAEGFTSQVAVTEDTGDDVYYTVTNTWVGPEYVTVKGDVKWEGDQDKEYLRPGEVQLSVINKNTEERVRTITVPVKAEEPAGEDTKWKWEMKYLPAKDKDGNDLQYTVLESHVKGYTIIPGTPSYDEATRTWTCDVTNKLTGYFPLPIKKVIEGAPEKEESYTFSVENKDTEDGTDRVIPLPVNNDRLTISSSAENKEVTADFLFDEDGVYLYSVKENPGKNEKCTYDDTEKLVMISRSTKTDPGTGKTTVEFKYWVADAEDGTTPGGDNGSVDGIPLTVTPTPTPAPEDEPAAPTPAPTDEPAAPAPTTPEVEVIYPDSIKPIEFVNTYANVTIKKEWEIDLLGQDKPDSIEVVVQKKEDGKWKNVKLVELNKDNDWTAKVAVSGDIRVRELKQKKTTIFDELKDKLKGMITGYLDDEYDSVISSIKNSEYYTKYSEYLPNNVKEAMDNKAEDLKKELNATSGNLFDKLVEQLGLASLLEEDRVVYNKGDEGAPTGDDAETNVVEYNVSGSSILPDGITGGGDSGSGGNDGGDGDGGGDDGHTTRYRVKYDESDGTYTITNTAIVEIDLIKRWLMFKYSDEDGVKILTEDDDMPDNAWVVLMFTLKPEDLAGDYSDQLSGLSEKAGIDISTLENYELPVFRLTNGFPFYLEGGMGPASVISQLTIGIDLGFLDNLIPCEMAIAKVDKDSKWRQHFVVGKYALGIPVEFKGAELGSEVLRQIVKYLSGGTINSPVSYNPFDNYFSIPTKAYPIYAGITDPSQLLDISGLAGKVLGAVKDLLLKPETWKNISFEKIASGTLDDLKDENQQMANVINIKIDWDISQDQILVKNWEGDEEANRPDTLKIYVKDELAEEEKEIEITLKKADFEGKDQWFYDLSELEDKEEGGDNQNGDNKEDGDDKEEPKHSYVVVREEYPEGYEHKKDYDCEIDGLEVTNTWKDPEKVIIRGKKIWEDDDDQDGIRPEEVELQLYSSVGDEEPMPVMVTVKEKDEDGKETEKEVPLTVKTSKQGNWKYYFPEQPRYKEPAEEEGGNAGGDDNNQAGGNDQNGGDGQTGGNGQNSGNEGEEKQEITYSVKEKETDVITGVDGEGTYAISYETKHEENENDNWVINVTNTHTTKKLTVEKKWVDKDGNETEWIPESVKVVLQHKKGAGDVTPEPEDPQESGSTSETGENPPAGNDQESGNGPESNDPQEGGTGAETPSTDTDTWETIGDPVELSAENEWKTEFKAKGLTESSVANGEWRIRELDADGKLIFAEGDEDAPKDEKDNTKSVLNNEIVLNVEKDGKNKDVPYVVSYEVDDGTGKESDGESGGESSSTSSSETGSTSSSEAGSTSSSETGEENTSTNSTKGNTVITNKVNGKEVTVEKSWDIDFAKKDHPESIEVVIQEKKEDDKWDTVALLELNGDNDWKDSRFLPDKRDDKEIEYRARELRQETALEEIVKKLRESISAAATGSYDQIIEQIKGQAGDYYNMLPDEIQDAAQQGSDKLKDQLKTTTENLYDKLLEKIGIAASEDRIVYDKDDKDKKTDDGKKEEDKSGDDQKDGEGGEKDKEQDVEKEKEKERKKSELNTVTYYVKEDNSVIPGTEGGTEGTGGSGESGHNTKYRVTYGKDGDTLKITNKAILEVDVIKRWIGIGVDDEDMPDAAWVVLMFSLDTEKIGEAGGEIGSEALGSFAKSINVNVNDLEGYEFPVFNLGNALGKETPFLLEEGQDPLAIISQLTIGVDLDIFGSFLPKMAIARVTKDDDWRVHYVVSKYAMGLPVNFKGAELGSELIRQIIKYVTGLNLFISYNPFDNFISIPTKAIPKFLDITDPKDLLDVSGLAGKALNKVKSLTSEELKNIGLNTFMDGSDLMANVINVKIDWDTSQDQILTKAWVGDEEENRPEYIEVYLKDGEQELEEPVKLENKDFKGENTWTYDLSELDKDEENTENSEDKDKDKTEHAYSVVREEYPEGYEHANDYDCKVDGLTITNTWKDPEKVTISGKKIWEDDDDKDGIRPEKITVKLLADGEEIKSVETSKEGGWKYHFADLPRYKDAPKDENTEGDGNETGGGDKTENEGGEKAEIVYTIEEEETDVITGEDGEGTYAWEVKEGSYDLVNTHTSAKITIEGTKEWDDADNQDGKRPDSITIRLKADGKEVDSVKVEEGQDGSWSWKFEDQPKTNGGKDITYTITEDKVEGYTTKIEGDAEKGFTVTNTYTPGKTQIKVTKAWDDKKDQDGIRPESVTVKLLADGEPVKDEEGNEVTLELSEDNSWTGTFEDLDEKKEGKAIDYSVEEETDDVITGEDGEGTYSVKVSGDMQKGFTVTNKHTPQTIRIEGKKVWEDENDQAEKRPDSIVIRLKAGGEEIRNRKVTNSNSWTWTFDGLPKYADGEEIEYTITEDSIPDYTTEIEGDAEDGFTVTNTYAPGKTQVTVTKVWKDEDDRDGIRPKSVTIRLLADGEEVKGEDGNPVTLVLSEGNSWTGVFADLPKYKEAEGEGSQDSEAEKTEIVYTIGEETTDVITGQDGNGTYAVEISGNAKKGFTVTNTHTPETAAVTVKKVWNDANNQDKKRPENITFRLLADGKEIRAQEVKEADDWSWSVDGLPKKQDGKDITYTVTEDTVPEYTTAIEGDATDGFTVTNTYTPGKTQVNVVKVWNDKEDQDGIRPTSVIVSLLADGEETGKTLVLSEGTNWSGTFTDLDAMKDGKAIAYTVNEKQTGAITGTDGPGTYEIKITGDAAKGFTITNRHTPETLAFDGVKIWNDAENQDGKRPASIRIRLKADGKDKVVKTVTGEDGWKWSYTNLPKYDGDREIVYTLTEDAVPDYTTSVQGSPQEGFTVTNTYNPGKTQVTVTKVWSDENDYDAIRPEKVKIFLLADGTRTRKDAELSEKNNWTYTFENLDVSKDGTEIRYMVEEDLTRVITGTDGDGTYAVNIKGTAAKGFTVTNTHTPHKIRIEVAKVWDDAEDQDGKRPDSVKIKLLADGKPVEVEGGGLLNLLGNTSPYTVTLSEETGWKGVFTGLDKKKLTDKGEWVDIVYTVEEELTNVITGKDGPGTYAKDDKKGDAENGFTVINTHTPETVTVEGKKTWTDSENQDGVRPQSITIRLLDGNNENVGQPITVTPDKDGVWKWTFTDLPKYKNGSVIKYSVVEDAVKDYTAAYTEPALDEQKDIWTCDITNTHTPGKTQVNVFKVWKDDLNGKDNADGIRPKSVTVKLLADGIPAKDKEGKERTLTLSESTGWSGTFTDLDEKKDGKVLTYTVEEETTEVITGEDTRTTYAIAVTGDQTKGYTITNTHTPVRYTIIYDLDGGTYNGSPDDIIEIYPYGTKISIHKAPVKAGYRFLYWEGSRFDPDDDYIVTENHRFKARWAPAATPTVTPIPGTPVNPANGPKTGDSSHMLEWLIVLLAAAAGLTGMALYRKKRGTGGNS